MTVETYVLDTTWVCPNYVESVVVECWGAGGFGATRTTNGVGGGAGGGAYAKKTMAVTPGQSYTVKCGVFSSAPHTWFASSGTVFARGGSNAAQDSAVGGAGGSAALSIGDIVYAGGSGGTTVGASGAGGGAGAEDNAAGQNGGTPTPGTGTYPGGSGANGPTQGQGGSAPGIAGGGGGALRLSSGVQIGGFGGSGQVKLTYTAGVTVAQVQSRYTRRVNGAAVGGDNYLGINVQGGGSTAGSTRNNGGTILRAGNVASPLWDNLNIGLRYALTGPIVYNTSALGNRKIHDKALSAGNFATMTAGSYIIRRVTTTLAGQSNTVLRSPAAGFGNRKSIHKATAWRTKFMYKVLYQKVTSTQDELTDGTARPEQSYTYYYSLNNVIGEQNSTATNPASLGVDVDAAATPSIAVPGQLIYRNGSRIPKLDIYKPRSQA